MAVTTKEIRKDQQEHERVLSDVQLELIRLFGDTPRLRNVAHTVRVLDADRDLSVHGIRFRVQFETAGFRLSKRMCLCPHVALLDDTPREQVWGDVTVVDMEHTHYVWRRWAELITDQFLSDTAEEPSVEDDMAWCPVRIDAPPEEHYAWLNQWRKKLSARPTAEPSNPEPDEG